MRFARIACKLALPAFGLVFSGQAAAEGARQPLPACDLASLPDSAPEIPVVDKLIQDSGARIVRSLGDVPIRCGFVVEWTMPDRSQRDDFLDKLPDYVRNIDALFFGLQAGPYTSGPDRKLHNAIVTEEWSDGPRRAAKIGFQTLDPARGFDPREGKVCVLFLSADFDARDAEDAKVASWNRAAEKLFSICMEQIELTPTARELEDRYRASDAIPDLRAEMERKASVLKEMADRLFPDHRPASWPAITSRKDEPISPPARLGT